MTEGVELQIPDEVLAARPADEGTGGGGKRDYKRDPKGSDTGGQFTKDPKSAEPAKTAPAKKAAPAKSTPAKTAPAKKSAPAKAKTRRLALRRGNSGASVRKLQALMNDLKIGKLSADGQFGPDTENAVKEAQRRIGMKPTGRASAALVRRLNDARTLSPCVKKVAAAEWEEDEDDDGRVMAKFNPGQPRDRRGRWSLTAAMIDALKAQGGEQGGAYFDDGIDGRFFDWSTFHPDTQTYQLEIGDGEDGSVAFDVGDNDLEQLFSSLSVTQLRDSQPDGDKSVGVATLTALGQADHVPGFGGDEDSYIDWSERTEDGNYRFDVGNGEDEIRFDLTPAELAKLIASLALSTQTEEAVGVMAAAGADTTLGGDELHHWWVFGKGRGRWNTWTELRDQLVEHVGPVKAAVFASKWFHERYGFWSGSDLNRVKNGKPPRGQVVGPG